MDKPAFLSDDLELEEHERIAASDTLHVAGRPEKTALLATIEREGQIDGVLESALLLSLEDYREVEAAWKAAPVPKKPKIRRRKK